MHRIVLLFCLLFASWNVSAQSVGTFTCNECLLTGPHPDPDTIAFIKAEVNPTLPDSSWQNGGSLQRVTICNASVCVVYQYLANGNFVQIASAPIGSGGGGDGGGYAGDGGNPYEGCFPVYVPPGQVCSDGICTVTDGWTELDCPFG